MNEATSRILLESADTSAILKGLLEHARERRPQFAVA